MAPPVEVHPFTVPAFSSKSRRARSTCFQVLCRPDPYATKRPTERQAQPGQLVFDLGRHDRVDRSREQSIALHLAQGLRQHLLADAFDLLAQARETQLPLLGQHLEDQHRPFVGDSTNELVDQGFELRVGAGMRCGSKHGVALRRRNLLVGELRKLDH
jgi:hypothetical protein